MKKLLVGLLAAFSIFTSAVFADADTRIVIDGEEQMWEGQKAVIVNDITMIPFRVIFESLGAHVEWIEASKSIVAMKGLTTVKMHIDSDVIIVNGEEKTVTAAPTLIDGTTMVPLRAMSEILGSEVLWDADTKTVSVTTEKTDFENKAETEYYTQEYNSDNGDLLLKVVVAYPAFEEKDGSGADVINALYKTHSKEFADEAVKQFSEMVKSEYDSAAAEERIFEPMIVLYGYEVVYDKYGFVSIAEQAGLAEGDVFYFDSVTFDFKTGELMKKEDFVNMSESEMASFAPYSFYLYGDQVILCLNSNNIYLYQYNNYPPSMAVPQEYLKYDLTTGEKTDWEQRTDEGENVTPESLKGERTEYSKMYELNNALGFKMADLKDQIKNVPVGYASVGDEIGEVTYERENGNTKVVLRKGMGDLDISGVADGEKIREELYKNSMIEFYKNSSCIYASFAIESETGISSYSVMIDNTSDLYTLLQLAKEIIDTEL